MQPNHSVGSWITRRAMRTPERTALVHAGQRVTYATLAARSLRLASALAAQGVAHGDRVAWVATHEPAAFELLLACGLIGAVGVPLSPQFGARTLTTVLGRIGARVLVAPAASAQALGAASEALPARRFTTGERVLGWQDYEALLRSGEPSFVPRPVALSDACLLMHSSGTTGAHKAVVLTHENMLFNAQNVITSLDYRRADSFLVSAPLHRMGGLGFSLPMWLVGGVCVLPEQTSPEGLLREIEAHAVTVLFDSVPSLVALSSSPRFAGSELSSLRVCATGGSFVPLSLVHAFRARGLTLQPGYGLTEASPVVAIASLDEVRARPGSAGRPALWCDVRVVDAQLSDVEAGEPGELLVRGPNVMRGYFEDPSATARVLLEDGWLRTGDVARRHADGSLDVLGRLDDALWVNGRVVYPAPIEAALCELACVAECALVQSEPNAKPELCVVARAGATLELDAILSRYRQQTGWHDSPILRPLAQLPRNAHGKLLRRDLRSSRVRGAS